MEKDKILREQLIAHIRGGLAFMPIEKMLEKISYNDIGIQPHNLPYSFYQQFYHLYYAQKDIIDFCIKDDYKTPDWPDDYWPETTKPSSASAWENLKTSFFQEREKFCEHIADSQNDLYASLKNGNGQTLLREAILMTEHSAYHTGQLLMILRLLNLHQ